MYNVCITVCTCTFVLVVHVQYKFGVIVLVLVERLVLWLGVCFLLVIELHYVLVIYYSRVDPIRLVWWFI